ncbi:MAG: aspartate ammonia-lyase [Pirellulales bacterium]|nr:aspartate ammonia-lyase [Pirellulales bacterium]
MSSFRREIDLLGEREVPGDALWGIHTLRAVENFPLAKRPVHPGLIHAFGMVKLAAAQTNQELGSWDDAKFAALETACTEMSEGRLDEHILVDALQGGAGTSTNMNVNEALANRALQLLGKPLGDYQTINPHDDVNLHQSTNDTYPTALKVAAIFALRELERKVVALLEAFQRKEKEFADVVKVGRTELQDAVLTTLGSEMAAYAESLARDRWRIYKCEERLRVVNLGGTAIGTGMGAPRQYIFRAVEQLRQITGLGLARAENLVEATQNADCFIEVSGILRTLAGNLLKIANDLRLLSSGPCAGLGEIRMPPRQAGSSIMPGKVNPVIPEAVCQAAYAVFGYDLMIVQAASGGNLELNHLYPLIADALLNSLDLLTNACDIFARHCVDGIEADRERCRQTVRGSTAILTALVEKIGYDAAERLANELEKRGSKDCDVKRLVVEQDLMTAEEFDRIASAENVIKLGSTERDVN